MVDYLDLIPIFAGTISLLADAGFFALLRRLPAPSQRRLFVRQLWQLAASNLAFTIINTSFRVMVFVVSMRHPDDVHFGLASSGASDHDGRIWCSLVTTAIRSTHQANMLTEMHIAASFLAANFKAVRTITVLSRVLLLAWPLGLLLGIGSAWELETHWNVTESACQSAQNAHDYVIATSLGVLISWCFACYVVSCILVCKSGQVILERVLMRMGSYLLVAIFVNLPEMYYYMVPQHDDGDGPPTWHSAYSWAELCTNLGGILNFILYALQSRFSNPDGIRQVQPLNAARLSAGASFRVAFTEQPSVQEPPSHVETPSHDVTPHDDSPIAVSYYTSAFATTFLGPDADN